MAHSSPAVETTRLLGRRSEVHIDPAKSLTKTERTAQITTVTLSSSKAFGNVITSLEEQLGRLDQERALAAGKDLAQVVKTMEGTSGLMIVSFLDMDAMLPALLAYTIRARQYSIGNPLIASKMSQHNTLAALYAPPRLLVYTQLMDPGKTFISYDQPSTVFGKLNSAEILETATELDQKFADLVSKALA
jgi:uncharacterized protein (DUF302 family)